MLHSICWEIWKIQQWPQDWKRSIFIPVPKKGNAKQYSNYHTIVLILHTSKVMLKILQARIQKAEKPEIKLPTSVESQKKQENSRKTSTFALLTMPMSFTVGCNKLWKILKEMGIPGHLTCLLRNLSAGQEVIVRTGHGTMNCFQIGIGLCQACILSPAYLIYMQSI